MLRTRNPGQILATIPGAKLFEHNGKELIAVKHGVEETKALRDLGFNAPSPILYYYGWPGRFEPFHAQKEAAAFVSLQDRAFNLSDMGTGKTLATLWAYDFLREMGVVHRAFVVTPLSTLERTWADEIFQHFPHLEYAVLHGTRERRLKLLNTDVDLYLINHDGIKVPGIIEALNQRPDIDLVVVDEIGEIGRFAGTARFKALNKIINGQIQRQAWGLTGTPTPNEPTEAWAQCRLLVPAKVPYSYKKFKDSVMRQVSLYKWLPRHNASEIVNDAMQPAIRFSIDECTDLPPCIYQERYVELTPGQKKAYKDMVSKLKAESEDGQILAVNEAVKAGKLVQIACGVAYGSDGGEVVFDATPRMEVVRQTIEQAGSKVIVFVPFVSVVHALTAFLRAKRIEVDVIYGEVSKNQRDDIFSRFQKTAGPGVIVAQPAAMSHGLTLTAASTIIWYAPIGSNRIFQQANGRIVRPGQVNVQHIVMIEGTEIERRYYQRLKDRRQMQGVLLNMIQGQRDVQIQEVLGIDVMPNQLLDAEVIT